MLLLSDEEVPSSISAGVLLNAYCTDHANFAINSLLRACLNKALDPSWMECRGGCPNLSVKAALVLGPLFPA